MKQHLIFYARRSEETSVDDNSFTILDTSFISLIIGDGVFGKRNSGSWEYAEFVEKKGNKIFFIEQKMVLDGSTDTSDLSMDTSV